MVKRSGRRLRTRMGKAAGNPSGLGAMALVLLVVLGIYLVAGGDPGSSTGLTGDGSNGGPVTIGQTPAPSSTATSTGGSSAGVQAGTDPASGLPWIERGDLPSEALDTLARIRSGGPYPYPADDQTFHNYEGVLPDRPDGYYREYTVDTSGSDDRGERRIVAGDDGELYYTDDHYETFSRIRP